MTHSHGCWPFATSRWLGSWVLLVLVSLVASPLRVAAQGPPVAAEGTDTGLQEGRSYFSPEPWEVFDQQSGDLGLAFTVLTLPGNAGRDLRIVRSYSNQRGWALGIAGLVMGVEDRGYFPAEPNVVESADPYALYVKSGPVLVTWDGGERQTFYTQTPSQWDPATQRIVMTEDRTIYNRDTHRLYQPDGTVCQYASGGLDYCEDQYGLFLEKIGNTYRQHLGDGQTRDVVRGWTGEPGAFMEVVTYDGRTWTFTDSAMTLPTGAQWTFARDPILGLLTSVTTPWGGQVDYTYVDHFEGHHPISGDPLFHGRVLQTRAVSGPGVTSGSWTIAQQFPDWHVEHADDVRQHPPEKVTITPPGGPPRTFTNCVGPQEALEGYTYIVGASPAARRDGFTQSIPTGRP